MIKNFFLDYPKESDNFSRPVINNPVYSIRFSKENITKYHILFKVLYRRNLAIL
jgi:hypothetical protein